MAAKRKWKAKVKTTDEQHEDKSRRAITCSSCQPLERTTSASIYRSPSSALPAGREVTELLTPQCNTDTSNAASTERNPADAISLQSFARRNSAPTVDPTNQNSNSLYLSQAMYPLHSSQLADSMGQSTMWYHNPNPTPYMAKRPIPRSITPFWEMSQDPHSRMDSSMFVAKPGKSHSFQNSPHPFYRMTSPILSNQVHDGNEMHPSAWQRNTTGPPYVCVSPTMDRAIHMRGDSLPVYPDGQSVHMNPLANWPQFEPIMDHSHTYQELSALTASLHRHPRSQHASWKNQRTLDSRPLAYTLVSPSHYGPTSRYQFTDDRTERSNRKVVRSPRLSECDEHVALLRDPSGLTSVEESMERSDIRAPSNECPERQMDNTSATDMEESHLSHTMVNQLTESSSTSGIVSDQLTTQRSPGAKYIYDAYREASFV